MNGKVDYMISNTKCRVVGKTGVSGTSGFTLIEILVTVVIMSVGMLGFTIMQASSIKSALLTRNLDSCVNLASDAIDRVRANAGDVDYGVDFSVSATESCSSDDDDDDDDNMISDEDHLCNAMEEMNLGRATLSVSFQTNTPISNIDTVTASVILDPDANPESCTFVNLIPGA